MALIDDKLTEIEAALAVVKAEAAKAADKEAIKTEIYAALEIYIQASQTGHMVQLSAIKTLIEGI